MNDEADSYLTRDMGLSTFLVVTDHELIRTSFENPQKIIFHFKKREDTDTLILQYFSGTARAPAKKLFETYRNLRGLVYTKLRSGSVR